MVNGKKILCVFGKHQYGDVSRGISTEYFSFIPAFMALGHTVSHFESWDSGKYGNYTELNSKLLDTVELEKPDVIFAVTLGYEIWLESWDIIRQRTDVTLIHWCTDDSWKFREHSRFIAPYFDLMVTTYEEFLPSYESIGVNSFLSAWGCPDQWLAKPKSASECKHEVTFVGSAHGNRKELVKKIADAGVKLECFGFGWPNGAIDAQDIPSVFRDSIISLNFANSKGEKQIKARTFEVPGAGGFLITESAKNLDSIFCSPDEIVIVEDMDELIEKILYYLSNTKARDEIAVIGNNKVRKQYTYSRRVSDILAYAQELPKKDVLDKKIDFASVAAKHTKTPFLNIFKYILITAGYLIFGRQKGRKFARRVAFEMEWRIRGRKTYGSSGWTGRMFYGY